MWFMCNACVYNLHVHVLLNIINNNLFYVHVSCSYGNISCNINHYVELEHFSMNVCSINFNRYVLVMLVGNGNGRKLVRIVHS